MRIRFEFTQSCSTPLHSLLCSSLFAVLTACGGGDHETAEARVLPAAQPTMCPTDAQAGRLEPAVFAATTDSETDRALIVVARADHSTVVFRGSNTDTGFSLARYIYECNVWHDNENPPRALNGEEVASDGGKEAREATDLQMSYDEAAVSGTVLYKSGESMAFSGGPLAAPYEFNAPASVDAVTGHWSIRDIHGREGTLDVAADGSYVVHHPTCDSGGRITPHASRKNLFSMGLSCGGDLGSSRSGFVLTIPLKTGGTQLLLWGAGFYGDWLVPLLAATGTR